MFVMCMFAHICIFTLYFPVFYNTSLRSCSFYFVVAAHHDYLYKAETPSLTNPGVYEWSAHTEGVVFLLSFEHGAGLCF